MSTMLKPGEIPIMVLSLFLAKVASVTDIFEIIYQLKRQSWRLVTIETLITMLTIENLNS